MLGARTAAYFRLETASTGTSAKNKKEKRAENRKSASYELA
jgi:hypothetical protein